MSYFDLISYLWTHPVESFFIILAEFFVVMKLHYLTKRIAHPYIHAVIHYPLALWFLPQDITVNLSLFSIVGREAPKIFEYSWLSKDIARNEWTITSRLNRWNTQVVTDSNSLRQAWIAQKLAPIINWIDPEHIK